MDSKFSKNLIQLIQTLDISQEEKSQLTNEIEVMGKRLDYTDFKLKRMLKDKDIITNILNETIKRLEDKSEALEIQAQKLEEQSKFKEQLFANVSHELRTPLHGVLGMGHLLEKTPLNVIQQGYVGIIKGSADNLLVIINDILSLSEINAGKIKIANQPFSLKGLLEDLEGMLGVRTQKKGLQLSFLVPPDVPEYVMGDRTRIYQIFLNLVNNSIKFTHQGYILVSSEMIYAEGNEVRLQFEVKDTGIGMRKEKLNSIFESFTRVHEDRGVVYEGTGLGLNIVKNLLYLLKGSVEVDSEYGKGTTFRIQIPFTIPSEEVIQELIKDQQESEIPEDWSQMRFLMIEDNSANILYAKDIFESWNLKLDIAPTLEEAEQLMSQPYDCILSDVILPDGNGLDFITQLRKNQGAVNQHAPVIILTASANEKGATQARKVNIQSYLSKPFPPEVLIKELHKIFNLKTTSRMTHEKESHPKPSFTVKEKKPIVNSNFIETLSKRFKGRTGLMVEMAKIFLDQAPVMIQVLEESPAKEDYEAIRFEAHKFKSTVNIVGLDGLRAFAMKTEETYHSGKPEMDTTDLLKDFVAQIKLDMEKVKLAIQQLTVVEVE